MYWNCHQCCEHVHHFDCSGPATTAVYSLCCQSAMCRLQLNLFRKTVAVPSTLVWPYLMQILSHLLVIYLKFSLVCLVSSRQNPGMYSSAAFYDWCRGQIFVTLRNLPRRGKGELLKKIIRLSSLYHWLSVNATQNKVTFKGLENATNYAFSTRLRGYVFRSISHAVDSTYQINQSWKWWWKPYDSYSHLPCTVPDYWCIYQIHQSWESGFT